MALAADSRLAAPESVVIRTFDDGESVLLNLDTEQYYDLNAVGSRMWELLIASPSVAAAYAALIEEYEVEPDILRHDLETLVADLIEQGLVIVDAAQPTV